MINKSQNSNKHPTKSHHPHHQKKETAKEMDEIIFRLARSESICPTKDTEASSENEHQDNTMSPLLGKRPCTTIDLTKKDTQQTPRLSKLAEKVFDVSRVVFNMIHQKKVRFYYSTTEQDYLEGSRWEFGNETFQDNDGIYVGSLEKGNPHGYGSYYHKRKQWFYAGEYSVGKMSGLGF
jgi:hypothetical protein